MNLIKNQLRVIHQNDPSVHHTWECFFHTSMLFMLYFRLSQFFYNHHLKLISKLVSHHIRTKLGIDCHPKAIIPNNLFIDHGIGIVIGETTIIGDNVIIYHGVTLGSRKILTGKRHPTIGNDVFIGSGAKILGNITIGDNVKIGANSVVIDNIQDNTTYVGLPKHHA